MTAEKHDSLAGGPAKPAQPPVVPERRTFFGVVIGLITAGIAGLLGVTIGRYSIAPALAPANDSEWTDAGLLDDIPEGQPVKRSVTITQDSGWGRFNSQRLVWIVRKGSDVTVFSATCPHLGCTINETTNGFICPCHGSAWNQDGNKLGGPAPRGMDVLEHRVDGDLLKVKYQYFKQGMAAKEPVS